MSQTQGNTRGTPEAIEVSSHVLWAIRALLMSALVVDGYLAWVSLSSGAVAGCGPDSNCHHVLNSRWAYWFGLPVSVPALLVYSAALLATFLISPWRSAAERRRAWSFMLLCSILVAFAGLWFIWLQIMVINRICPFCMVAHGSAILASLAVIAAAPVHRSRSQKPDSYKSREKPGQKSQKRAANRKLPERLQRDDTAVVITLHLTFRLGLMAAAGVALLIAGQLMHQPKSYASAEISAGFDKERAPAERWFQVFGGEFRFNLHEIPLLGRPDAPHGMVNIFDYTCHHCRELHRSLEEAASKFSNELAVINLPMPLDGQCNPIIRVTQPAHTNACALARIGLAVWRANRTLSRDFEHWIFSGSQPPLPDEAEQYARDLIGNHAFEKAMRDPWVGRLIDTNIALFQATALRLRKGIMPQLIIGTNLTSGMVPREDLFRILSEQFGLGTDG
jgi:uncharacterized membrane protein